MTHLGLSRHEARLVLATLDSFNVAIENMRRHARAIRAHVPEAAARVFQELDTQLDIASMEAKVAHHIEQLRLDTQ